MNFANLVIDAVDVLCAVISTDGFHKEYSISNGKRYMGLTLDGDIDYERSGFSLTLKFDTYLI